LFITVLLKYSYVQFSLLMQSQSSAPSLLFVTVAKQTPHMICFYAPSTCQIPHKAAVSDWCRHQTEG